MLAILLRRNCPLKRQTLLFSATMTPKVEDLVKLSLQRPVRIKVDGKATTVAPRLVGTIRCLALPCFACIPHAGCSSHLGARVRQGAQ